MFTSSKLWNEVFCYKLSNLSFYNFIVKQEYNSLEEFTSLLYYFKLNYEHAYTNPIKLLTTLFEIYCTVSNCITFKSDLYIHCEQICIYFDLNTITIHNLTNLKPFLCSHLHDLIRYFRLQVIINPLEHVLLQFKHLSLFVNIELIHTYENELIQHSFYNNQYLEYYYKYHKKLLTVLLCFKDDLMINKFIRHSMILGVYHNIDIASHH